ncbi:unnamed protein product [Ixodes pacificus]
MGYLHGLICSLPMGEFSCLSSRTVFFFPVFFYYEMGYFCTSLFELTVEESEFLILEYYYNIISEALAAQRARERSYTERWSYITLKQFMRYYKIIVELVLRINVK